MIAQFIASEKKRLSLENFKSQSNETDYVIDVYRISIEGILMTDIHANISLFLLQVVRHVTKLDNDKIPLGCYNQKD